MAARKITLVKMVILLLILTCETLAVGIAMAQETRIATIVIYGLHRIDRGQLLEDLVIAEGDNFSPAALPSLELRARKLPYLRFFKAQSRIGTGGLHLTFRVREAKQLRMAPYARVIEDGRLVAGFQLNAEGLIRNGETWEGGLQIGARADIRILMQDWRPFASWMPGLCFNYRIQDWENTFLATEELKSWLLGGLSLNLPHGGRLLSLAGRESVKSRYITTGGTTVKTDCTLYRNIIRQPLPLGVELRFTGETRYPASGSSFSRGDLRLRSRGSTGKWQFDLQGAVALAEQGCPPGDLYFADSWDYLRGYPAGSLPARELWFGRLREEIYFFNLPLRLRRGAQAEDMLVGGYLLYENALFRVDDEQDYSAAYDWGGGIAIRIPSKIPLKASLGIQWNEEGDPVTIFLLEEI